MGFTVFGVLLFVNLVLGQTRPRLPLSRIIVQPSEGRYRSDNDGRYVPERILIQPGSQSGRYRGEEDGRYVPSDDGRYRGEDDGRYHPDDAGKYVSSTVPYIHDADKYINDQSTTQRYVYQTTTPKTSYQTTPRKLQTLTPRISYQTTTRKPQTLPPLTVKVSPEGAVFGSDLQWYGPNGESTLGVPSGLEQDNPSGLYDNRFYRILFLDKDMEPDGGYTYIYETENRISGQEQGKTEEDSGNRATGFYKYTGPDGLVYLVRYRADEDGFSPEGLHLPTPPPIPPLIQKALKWQEEQDALAART